MKLTPIALTLVLLLSASQARADMFAVHLDDSVTVEFDGVGLLKERTVPSGSVINVEVYFISSSPTPFDSFGIDVNFNSASDSATAALMPGSIAAGSVASAGGDQLSPPPMGSLDLITSAAVLQGNALAASTLTPATGFNNSLGGAGYFDSASGSGTPFPTPGRFFGLAAPPISGTPFDVITASFMVTGNPGDTVTFKPTGIFTPLSAPETSGTLASTLDRSQEGDALYDSFDGLTRGLDPSAFMTSTVTIAVPEPSAFLCVGLVGCSVGFVRRLRRSWGWLS